MHEADELHGCGAYAESKIEAEYLSQGARLAGMCVSILRCADMVGPGARGALEPLFSLASLRPALSIPILGWQGMPLPGPRCGRCLRRGLPLPGHARQPA